jgi:hypothetical protein
MNERPKLPVSCSQPELADLYPLYIHGNVGQADRQRIEGHLAECEKCRDDMKFFIDLRAAGTESFSEG